MIGPHQQGNVDDWPQCIPNFYVYKTVDNVQRCVEAKGHNPQIYTVVRHHVGEQNPAGDQIQKARDFFRSFVDDSFRQIAWSVNAVQEWNEYFANSQGTEERNLWINWAKSCVYVWEHDYRILPEYKHIDLILAETSVGNDIPIELAKVSHEKPWVVLGYHPYVPVWQGAIRPDDWIYYSGRWNEMDKRYRQSGYRVRWFFGEFGAVGHNGPGWPNSLAPNDGWRDSNVYDGNVNDYVNMIRYWMEKTSQTVAWKEGRVIGATIFTSGGGQAWSRFEVRQPELNIIAKAVKDFMTSLPDVDPPDPPDPPDPEPDCKGLPREQYRRVYLIAPQDATLEEWLDICRQAYPERNTAGFSFDDAGIGDLDNKTAVVYGIPEDDQAIYLLWFQEHYPGTLVEFRDLERFEINYRIAEMPQHPTKKYGTRTAGNIDTIVIHHTVTPNDYPTEKIAAYHIQEHDWAGIGYHYIVNWDGTIEQVQYDNAISNHTYGENDHTIGVALKGDFTYHQPTVEQIRATQWLVDKLKMDYPTIHTVIGHKEAPQSSTACPGATWGQWQIT